MARKKKKRLAVIDLETDPFLFGRKPEPFAAGFFDGVTYVDFWGDDAVKQLYDFLEDKPNDYYLFAHNGGKFDFIYFVDLKLLENPVKVINGRIVSAGLGRHILRDSYAFLPMPLSAFKKDEIDYTWFERENRDAHKNDILHYLAKDCEYLFELVRAFVDRFGVQLTIGGTSIKKIAEMHPFIKQDQYHDSIYRPFYFGGRVQCFQHGEIHGDLKVYDVNSMYPYVMRDYLHPTGRHYYSIPKRDIIFNDDYDLKELPKSPYFIRFIGKNFNALPTRTKTGLDFTVPWGEFYTTSHEFKVAMKYGLIKPEQILEVHAPLKTINFTNFVETYAAEKIQAKERGDKISEIFAKFLLNSGYGKFGQNPDNFKDWIFRTDEISAADLIDDGYTMYQDYNGVELWERPSDSESYFDVATAASITGAARSVLLENLQHAEGVIYCDTDSIICTGFGGEIDPYKLGYWDLEKTGDRIFVYAKKIYALFDGAECVKSASKGVRMTGADIVKLCNGVNFKYQRDAPAFKMSGNYSFIERELKGL